MDSLHNFFNLRKPFTAFSGCCDIFKQLVSFTATKSTKQEWVSESVSYSDKHSQWSDSGPIKIRPPSAIEIALGQSLGPRGAKSLLWQILRSEGGVFPMACIPTRNSPLTFSFPGSVWKNIIPETYRKITIGRLLSNDNVKFNLSLSGKKCLI